MKEGTTFKWRLHQIDLFVYCGDFFKVNVEAVVNSEQSDFNLAFSPYTISGQLNQLIGLQIQDELDQLTQRNVLPAGTVLTTSGGAYYKKVFHAGYHEPHLWLDPSNETEQTEYLRIIRQCIRTILQSLDSNNVSSIAFPLIGCGVFGLDPSLLAYEFFSELCLLDRCGVFKNRKAVWLVENEEVMFTSILNSAVQALIDINSPVFKNEKQFGLGVDYLDEFERKFRSSNHPHWASWMLVRYTELLLGYIFFYLAKYINKDKGPRDIFEEDRFLPFGIVREKAENLSELGLTSEVPWTNFFSHLLISDKKRRQSLTRINIDRNNIAHGREGRRYAEIYDDLCDFLNLKEWHHLFLDRPCDVDLNPWTVWFDDINLRGVFERWRDNKNFYLIPTSGESRKIEEIDIS